MFKIATAIVNPPSGNSAAGFALLSDTNYAPIAQTPIPSTVPATIDATAMTIAGGIGSIAVPASFQATSIEIGGKVYQFTLNNPPDKGLFTILQRRGYANAGGNLIIGLLDGFIPQAIAFYPYNPPIPTNFIEPPYPNICTLFPLKGELSWTLTWEEQPTANLSFITLAGEKDKVIDYFSSNSKIYIYDVGFSPTGQLSINEISLTKSAIPLIEVSVNLTGCHARFLDIYTTVGKQLFLPDCTAPPITQLNSPDTMSVQTLAQQVGANLIGESIYIDPKILSNPAVPTTLGSQLQTDSIRVAGGFIDYNNPQAIEIKKYNSVRSHQITEAQIRSDIQSTISQGKNGYYKTYDPLTKVSFGSQATQVPNTKSPKPEWQPKQPVSSKTSDGDPNPSINPYGGNERDLSIVFDISGKRKRRKDIDLIDGQPVYEYEQEWGWVAVAKDDFEYEGDPPNLGKINGSWKQIMSKTTYYSYDKNNYLTTINSSGFILTRFRVENAQKPESLAVRIEGSTPDPGEVAQLETFRFFSLPAFGSEVYNLAPFSNYYSDVVEPKVQWSICLPDGQPTEISLTDKSWIPPYFTIEKTVEERAFASRPNPKSTALKPLPPLTTGKNTLFTERINIEKLSIFDISTNKPKDPTYYTKSIDDQSSSGAQFNSSLSIAKSELVNGRPPISTNRGAILEVVKPPERGGTNIVNQTTLKPIAIKSGLSTEEVGYVTVNNINFPTAYNEREALAAAQIDIDLINAKNSVQEQMTVNWRPDIRPGDLVTYKVGDDVRSRRVISVSQKIEINGLIEGVPFITSNGTELKLGTNTKTPVVVSKLQERRSTILL
jgi:hypothetical protein